MRIAPLGLFGSRSFDKIASLWRSRTWAKLEVVVSFDNDDDDPRVNGDIRLALSAIASEMGIDVDALPAGVTGVLRGLSAAHYQMGMTEATRRLTRAREVDDSDYPPTLASVKDVTPAFGPYGSRRRDISAPPTSLRYSARPTPLLPPDRAARPSLRATPMVPPPWESIDDDSQDLH